MIREPCDGIRRWPCCLAHVPACTAGCGDPSTRLARQGKVIGAFCTGCYRELVKGEIPDVITRRPPRRPKGVTRNDLQRDAEGRR